MYKRGPSEQGAGRAEGGGQKEHKRTSVEWSRGRAERRDECLSKEASRESRSRARCEPMRSSCGAPDIALVNSSSQNEAARKSVWHGYLKTATRADRPNAHRW
jgi:hypothetical protein